MEPSPHAKPQLDWLRFSAALMVVVKHAKDNSFVGFNQLDVASRASLFTKALFAVTRYGEEAVLVFFVLSGFLVGGATFRRLRQGSFCIRDYAADRVSRIMLPLIPAILISWVVGWSVGWPPNPWVTLGNMASLQGVTVSTMPFNVPLWTLSYEVWFYVLNGAVATLLAKRGDLFAAIALAAGLIVFSILRLEYLLCWYLGALVFLVPAKATSQLRLISAGGLLVLACLGYEAVINPGLGLARWTVTARLGVGASVMVLARELAAANGSWAPALGARLAGFSYSLYLIHYPVLNLIRKWAEPSPHVGAWSMGLFLIRIVLCVVVGNLFYLCFERQTPQLRRWLRALGGSAPASASSELSPQPVKFRREKA